TGMFTSSVHDSNWDYFVPAHCSIYSVHSLGRLRHKLSAHRSFAVRHPFVDIPYLLTGEIWNKNGAHNIDSSIDKFIVNRDLYYYSTQHLLGHRCTRLLSKL